MISKLLQKRIQSKTKFKDPIKLLEEHVKSYYSSNSYHNLSREKTFTNTEMQKPQGKKKLMFGLLKNNLLMTKIKTL